MGILAKFRFHSFLLKSTYILTRAQNMSDIQMEVCHWHQHRVTKGKLASLWMPVYKKKRISKDQGWMLRTELWELGSLPSGIAEENVSMKIDTIKF